MGAFAIPFEGYAQKYRSNRYSRLNNDNYISLSAFKTPLPYSYGGKIGYHHSIFENTYLHGEGIFERGRPFQLKYNYLGADIGLSYAPFDLGRSIYLYFKGMGSAGYNMITEMKSNNAFSIGAKAGAELDYYIDDTIAIGGFYHQGLYAKNSFGTQRNEYGLIMKISLGW